MVLCSESEVGKLFLTGPDSINFRLVCHMISAAMTQSYYCIVKQPPTLHSPMHGVAVSQ